MKRLISAILILLMLIPSAFAAEPAGMKVSLTGGNVTQLGDTIAVRLKVENAPACAAMRFFFTYDGTVLEFVKEEQLNFNGYMTVNPDPFDDGRAKIGIAAANSDIAFQGNADLCEITFRVKNAPAQNAEVFHHYYHEFFEPRTGVKINPAEIAYSTITYNPNGVLMPNLIGTPQAEAIAALQALGLVVPDPAVAPFDPNYEVGAIVWQSEAADAKLQRGQVVTLKVNGPRPLVGVPNLIGKAKTDAKTELEAKGFQVAIQGAPFDGIHAVDEVIGQSEAVNAQLPVGSLITLTVISDAQNVEVPSLVGLTQAEATAALAAKMLTVQVKTLPYTLGYTENQVLTQSVAAGTQLLQGNIVTIEVNGAPERKEVPLFVGMTKEEALNLLQISKFNLISCNEHPYSLLYKPNSVIDQSVQAYTTLLQGSGIALTVNGMPQNVTVPNVLGKTSAEANAMLSNLQLKTSSDLAEYNMNYPVGAVIAQSVPAESQLLQGETVHLTINGLPGNSVVPALAGKPLADAAAALTAAKLNYTTQMVPFNLQYAPGAVINQSMVPGTLVIQGSSITLSLNGQPQTLNVPNLKGKTRAEAEAMVLSNQYYVYVRTDSYNPGYAPGVVIDQSTVGPLIQGSTITLIINGAKPPLQNPFIDVPADAYYEEGVLWAVEKEITNGTEKNKFSPDMACSRGQIVTFLWRANGKPEPSSSANPFIDLDPNAYYYKAVLWAVENGITNGTEANKFSPDMDCNRGQIVTFLHRSQGKPKVGSANPFVDVANGSYYYDAVLWAVENEITNGTEKNKFSPDMTCSRGQIVTFLYRSMT